MVSYIGPDQMPPIPPEHPNGKNGGKSPIRAIITKLGEAFRNAAFYILKPYFILKSEDRVNKVMNYLIRNQSEQMVKLSKEQYKQLTMIVQEAAKENLYSNFEDFIANVNGKIIKDRSFTVSSVWLTVAVNKYAILTIKKRNKVQEIFNRLFFTSSKDKLVMDEQNLFGNDIKLVMDVQNLFGNDILIPKSVEDAISALSKNKEAMKQMQKIVEDLKKVQQNPKAYSKPAMIRNGDVNFVEEIAKFTTILSSDSENLRYSPALNSLFVALGDRYFKVFNMQSITDSVYLLFDDKSEQARVVRAQKNMGTVELFSGKSISGFKPVSVNTFIRNTFERKYEQGSLVANMTTTLATFTKQGEEKRTDFSNRLVLRGFSETSNEAERLKNLGIIVHSITECSLGNYNSFYEMFNGDKKNVIIRLFGIKQKEVEQIINAVFGVNCPEGFAEWLLKGCQPEEKRDSYNELYQKLDTFVQDMSNFADPIPIEYSHGLNRLTQESSL